jgi:hypothetical protein
MSLLKAKKFKVFYSLDNGTKWEQIGTDFITGTGPFWSLEWDVPLVTRHRKHCLIKMAAYNAHDKRIATTISAYPFRVETVDVTSPEEGASFLSSQNVTITWATAITTDPIYEVKLYYSLNYGSTWKEIDTIAGNPETYTWTVPKIKKSWSWDKIRVVLKDDKGKTVGRNESAYIHLRPAPLLR